MEADPSAVNPFGDGPRRSGKELDDKLAADAARRREENAAKNVPVFSSIGGLRLSSTDIDSAIATAKKESQPPESSPAFAELGGLRVSEPEMDGMRARARRSQWVLRTLEIRDWIQGVLNSGATTSARTSVSGQLSPRVKPMSQEEQAAEWFTSAQNGVTLCKFMTAIAPHLKCPFTVLTSTPLTSPEKAVATIAVSSPPPSVSASASAMATPPTVGRHRLTQSSVSSTVVHAYARDNIANFLRCCRDMGVPLQSLFVCDDLVSRKNDDLVLSALLHLARCAVKLGVAPPLIVQYEMEIESEDRTAQDQDVTDREMDSEAEAGTPPPATEPVVQPASEATPPPTVPTSTADVASGAAPLSSAVAQSRVAEARTMGAATLQKFPFPSYSQAKAIEQQQHDAPQSSSATPATIAVSALPVPQLPLVLLPSEVKDHSPQFKYLPMAPLSADEIDVAMAQVMNTRGLDIRVRKVRLKTNKTKVPPTSKSSSTRYRFGTGPGSEVSVAVRLLQGNLMVHVEHLWVDLADFVSSRLAMEKRMRDNTRVTSVDDLVNK